MVNEPGGIDEEAGVASMPSCDQYPSRRVSSPEFGDTRSAFPSAGAQATAEAFASIITAQLAVFELMSRCAFTWIDLPVMFTESVSPRGDAGQQHIYWGNGSLEDNPASFVSGAGWFEPQIFTGLEDTLNDEFFKPRPRKAQQRDILVLLDRSLEDGGHSIPHLSEETEMHPKAA